ncbi:MAG: hypothetical protein WAU69_05780 [Solirubrobacteraceae bacterium]
MEVQELAHPLTLDIADSFCDLGQRQPLHDSETEYLALAVARHPATTICRERQAVSVQRTDDLVKLTATTELGPADQLAGAADLPDLAYTGCPQTCECRRTETNSRDIRNGIEGIGSGGGPVARAKLDVHAERVDDEKHSPKRRDIPLPSLKLADLGAL